MVHKLCGPRHRSSYTGYPEYKVCLVQEHPKISLKATYMSFCGVSIMERIPLETSSSILPNFTRCTKSHKEFHAPIYLIYLPGLKFTITFNYYCEYATYRHSSPSSVQDVCHMDWTYNSTSLLWLSGRASGLVTRRS